MDSKNEHTKRMLYSDTVKTSPKPSSKSKISSPRKTEQSSNNTLAEIFKNLLNFRSYQVALVFNITKAYISRSCRKTSMEIMVSL